jgi:hypothetical protein
VDPFATPERFLLNEFRSRVVSCGVFKRTSMTQALTLVCVITLLMAQAFGGVVGYLCRCGGEQVLTQIDHCHGPHSESCHDEQSQAFESAEQHAHDNCCDTENHEPVRQDVQLAQVSSFEFQAPVFVLLADSSELFVRCRLKADVSLVKLWKDVSPAPPQGVFIGRTVVLLV